MSLNTVANGHFKKDKGLTVLVDRMIRRLLTNEFLDGFSDEQLTRVIYAARDILQPLGALIEVAAPVVIFGDIHGQFGDLLRYLRIVGAPPEQSFLFLGDYVDRGRKGLEVIMLLFCFKVKYPKKVHLLRGNHECARMNRLYGFYEECKRLRSTTVWSIFQLAFNELPLCAKVNNRLICMHGGISPLLKGWHSLENLEKPRNPSDCDSGLALDLMWSDPNNDPCFSGFVSNKIRNTSWMFGQDAIRECTKALGVDMVVRGHEVVKNGHSLECNGQICTLFSAPNYCGTDGNCGSVMCVNKDFGISFVTLRPTMNSLKLNEEVVAMLEKQYKSNIANSPNPGKDVVNQMNEEKYSESENTFNDDDNFDF